MKIQGIIHQNISQLKWHILASLAVIMVLPAEEFIVGLKDGYGFDIGLTVISSIIIAPFLAGLIACANVQADLDERRYIFWRSKPAGVKSSITLKYFIGIVLSVFILACPIILWTIVSLFSSKNLFESDFWYIIFLSFFFVIMTYSLCFASNIVVRSTARSWLIGILLAGFVLIFPFFLPLGYKDYFDIYDSGDIFMIIVAVSIVFAFIFSLFAAQHDWHLKTNLRRLLWVIAGLVFIMLMLFSSQVANIKVLQEKEIEPLLVMNEVRPIGGILAENYNVEEFRDYLRSGEIIRSISSGEGEYREAFWEINPLEYVGDKVLFRLRYYIDEVDNKISLGEFKSTPEEILPKPVTDINGYGQSTFPYNDDRFIREINGNLYSFYIYTYDRTVEAEPHDRTIYEKVFLRSYKYTGHSWITVCELDISECITDDMINNEAMRIIGDKLFAFIDKSFAEVDITNPEDLKMITSKVNILPRQNWYFYYMRNKENKVTIPLIPAEEIDIEERIRLSIDRFYHSHNMYDLSIVDIYNKKISYFLIDSSDGIARYEVTGWNQDEINCELKSFRKLTMLEGMTGAKHGSDLFVKNGRLYYLTGNSLMVFDVRSDNRIRKLGHFVRINYEIQDIAVLEDDNILLCLSLDTESASDFTKNPKRVSMCLLKAP
ncbi:MAG: hypothetical protein JXA96_04115 [Sedimentisphaerales bacterium]|nr:hypothetical protein [Sedimentisphaerales bacterium]